MARPLKKGLDYFPLDVDFYRDIKVRKLMRSNGGGKAIAVYTLLLCNIYESGYYMLWDKDSPFMLSDALGFDEGYVNEVTKYCVSVGLFDKELFDTHRVLTSRSIQSRYFAAKRKSKGVLAMPYVYEEFICATETPSNGDNYSNNVEINGVSAAKTQVIAAKTPIVAAESTQKESKVKDKSSLRSDLPSSSSTATSRVRDGDEPPRDGETVDGKTVVGQLKQDRDWLLQMQRRHGIEAGKIIGWLNAFVVECDCRGTQAHESKSDVMRHFNDWLNIQLKPKKGEGGKGKSSQPQEPDYRQLWVRAKAELCKSLPAEQSAKSFDLMEYYDFAKEEHRLVLSIPSDEVYQTLESDPCVKLLQATLGKYFGKGIRLGYKMLRSGSHDISTHNV